MSVSYSIDVAVDLLYTEENIKYIVTNGKDKNFIYLDSERRIFLSVDDVVQKKMSESYSETYNEDFHVRIKYQDTFCFLWFFKSDENKIIFSIGSFDYRWDKDFNSGKVEIHTIDFARYIRLMLEVCSEVPILALSTDADNREELTYQFQNSVVAIVDMGFLEKDVARNIDYGWNMVESFLMNGICNQFQFFDKNTSQLIEPSVQECYDILKAGFPVLLYVKKDAISFKIELGHGWFAVYPLEPYRMKKGYESEEEKIDVAFYVQRLVELCENFAIYELKTFI